MTEVKVENCTTDPYSLSQDVSGFYAQVLAKYLMDNGAVEMTQTKITDFFQPKGEAGPLTPSVGVSSGQQMPSTSLEILYPLENAGGTYTALCCADIFG